MLKILVLSRNENLYSTKRILEEGLKRNHLIEVVDYTKCHMVMEKGKPFIYYGDKDIGNIDAIIPRIGATNTFYGTAVIRQFEMKKVFTTCGSLALLRARDKLRSLQILAKAGIDIPKTAFAKYPADINYLIEKVGGPPLIIKLLEGTQGLGVVLAESKTAARSVLEAFYGLKANILVQEYIKESSGEDIRAFVIDNKVVASIKRKNFIKDEFRANIHRGGIAEEIQLTKKEQQIVLRAAKSLGLKIAGIDLLRSKRGPLVLEVNPSPGLEGVEKASNINIAGKIIHFIEKHIKDSKNYKKQLKDRVGV
ncbi:MAG: putative alpha-L-glutamate ligase [Leptospiraceae bacterium]|nr:MAG: putative alpha-L-glutamate ligase [Leptospiraceae bacterium]